MNKARIVLIEDNPREVLLVEMALKENGIAYDLTSSRMVRRRFGSSSARLIEALAPLTMIFH
jgi:hypothetical protein